ncbi:MAG: polysaccharide deacetylase family protein, partial [Acidobacteria bacterium]|nr:polysaccharide deacetylase family protein [Acidobacteriota bacterium]
HGYAHRLVYEMTPAEFLEDARKSKGILEKIVGQETLGYRSSGFSVTEKTPWFFQSLIEAGFQYDSSVFPVARGHGGLNGAPLAPYVIESPAGALTEFPMTVTRVLGRPLCFFGGGYLRLFPYSVIRHMTERVTSEGRPVIFYIHPREVDPRHPRLPMGMIRAFKSYVNVESAEGKIRRLVAEIPVTSFRDFLTTNPVPSGHGHVFAS